MQNIVNIVLFFSSALLNVFMNVFTFFRTSKIIDQWIVESLIAKLFLDTEALHLHNQITLVLKKEQCNTMVLQNDPK